MSEELIQRLRVAPTASHFLKPAHLYQDLIAERSEAADYIEEQAARIAELEAALDSDPDGSGYWRFWSGKAAEQANRATASQARLSEAVKVLEEASEHIETLSELLKVIKESWIDYDHVFSIAVHEADQWIEEKAKPLLASE